jgi:acyl carrier protein
MIPAFFVQLENLPLTANGKIDRRALPRPESSAELKEHAVPRTLIEQTLADIWAEVLHLDHVGIHDNFFDLGGHSLLAMKVLTRTREILHIEVSPRTLFELPTIADQAEHVLHLVTKELGNAEGNELGNIPDKLESNASLI